MIVLLLTSYIAIVIQFLPNGNCIVRITIIYASNMLRIELESVDFSSLHRYPYGLLWGDPIRAE